MTKLDDIAVNIQLVLMSIIEGVALGKIAEMSIGVFHGQEILQHLPYILAGFTILLVFWSQAILHVVSFIRWPLHMEQMALYFVAVFLQIVAYSTLSDSSAAWFFWWSLFSFVVWVLYVVDLRILKQVAPSFAQWPGGATYIAGVLRRHIYELKFLVPVAFVFNVAAFTLTFYMPGLFVDPLTYGLIGSVQFLIAFAAMLDCIKNFKERSAVLPTLFEKQS